MASGSRVILFPCFMLRAKLAITFLFDHAVIVTAKDVPRADDRPWLSFW